MEPFTLLYVCHLLFIRQRYIYYHIPKYIASTFFLFFHRWFVRLCAVTIHSHKVGRIISCYPSNDCIFANSTWDFMSFLRKICAGIRQEKLDTPGNTTVFGGTICFAVSMFYECASPITHTMQPISCTFRQRHLRVADIYRVFFTLLCVAAYEL